MLYNDTVLAENHLTVLSQLGALKAIKRKKTTPWAILMLLWYQYLLQGLIRCMISMAKR